MAIFLTSEFKDSRIIVTRIAPFVYVFPEYLALWAGSEPSFENQPEFGSSIAYHFHVGMELSGEHLNQP